jgi:methylenetetrahydrofolate dehydrogenase (NADP+) / methenyltetrahydrofolate cyclohydrolase
MILLDGKTLSEKILTSLSVSPHISLHIILIGRDPSSVKYVSLKEKKCQEIGLKCTIHRLESTVSETELLNLISALNNDSTVTGFFVQLPLPKNFDQSKILTAIDPKKDVDGLNPSSEIFPAVANGIIRLLDEYHLNSTGKNVVIVNDSSLIGQPLKTLFENRHAIVTLCNKFTNCLSEITSEADILISATGVKNLITADYVKNGAIVIDVANGDIDFSDVSPKCSYITPTFGGIGPMTIASLLTNLVKIKP